MLWKPRINFSSTPVKIGGLQRVPENPSCSVQLLQLYFLIPWLSILLVSHFGRNPHIYKIAPRISWRLSGIIPFIQDLLIFRGNTLFLFGVRGGFGMEWRGLQLRRRKSPHPLAASAGKYSGSLLLAFGFIRNDGPPLLFLQMIQKQHTISQL